MRTNPAAFWGSMIGMSVSGDPGPVRRVRAFCAESLDVEGGVEGIDGHVEIDYEDGQSALGAVSPTFQAVADVVDWARQQAPEVVVRIGSTLYWEGPGELPEDAIPLDLAAAEEELQVARRNGYKG